tara:strand:- start:18194 stop:19063 length:870 start_codon:yes stop_codon:yes gene_type:complete
MSEKLSDKLKNLFAKNRGAPPAGAYPKMSEFKAYKAGQKFANKKIPSKSKALITAKTAKNLRRLATLSQLRGAAIPAGIIYFGGSTAYKIATAPPETKAKIKKLKTKLSKTSTKDYHADLLKMKVGGDTMLKNPKKADLDKDGKLSSYEKKRGKAIEANMKAKKGKMMKAKSGDMAKINKVVKGLNKASKLHQAQAKSLKTIKANVGMAAERVRDKEKSKEKKDTIIKFRSGKKFEKKGPVQKVNITKASMGMEAKSTRGYGAARTSGMGLQDEQLIPGKSLDYYKDLM